MDFYKELQNYPPESDQTTNEYGSLAESSPEVQSGTDALVAKISQVAIIEQHLKEPQFDDQQHAETKKSLVQAEMDLHEELGRLVKLTGRSSDSLLDEAYAKALSEAKIDLEADKNTPYEDKANAIVAYFDAKLNRE